MLIYRHKQFNKDWNKVKLNDEHYTKFIKYTNCLINNQPLPKEAKDHSLLGEYREFHLGGDMLLIYQQQNNAITFYRIGTHNQLFN